jgi:hypothetical protein
LIGELGTELDRAAVTDQFFIPPGGSLHMGSMYRTRLALSRGFVDGPVTILFGAYMTGITTSLGGDASVVVNNEMGEVVITGPDLQQQYVSVSYTAGFNVDPEDSEVYVGIPEWLTDIARVATMAALDSNSPGVRYPDDAKGAAASALALQKQVSGRLSSKARYFPNSNRPL